MTGYAWKLLRQLVGTIGLFFLIMTVFQNNSEWALSCQNVLRDSFTTDADLTPVVNFLYDIPQSVPENAVQVNAPFSKMADTIAVPVAGKIVSHYGWNEGALNQPFAEGVLIETAADEEICAVYDGTVISLEKINKEYQIVLAHANGLVTSYGNCRQVYIKPDGVVKKGDVIGITANDSDDGGQLYFTAKYLGEPVDPLELFQNM